VGVAHRAEERQQEAEEADAEAFFPVPAQDFWLDFGVR